jgi:hypothetical protein
VTQLDHPPEAAVAALDGVAPIADAPEVAPAGPAPEGRLSHVLQTRAGSAPPAAHGHAPGATEPPMVIAHREALVYTLGKAAELEHLVLCQYLFAAFSLRTETFDGLDAETLKMTKRWRRGLLEIAEQEMLHFALVQNLLTAVGAAPKLGRTNFPVPLRSYPANVRMALLPFGEMALRHFAFLERPEGHAMDDVEEFAVSLEKAVALPPPEDEIGPTMPDFETVGHLYRSIEEGLEQLAARIGEEALFLGPRDAQATPGDFFDELIPVVDLASARQAIETIVEQGEGARGDWRDAHFGRLIRMLDELVAAKEADPAFQPTRPVLAASVRPPDSGVAVPIITDPFTIRCVDLLNAVYEVLLQLLARYFAHTTETPAQLSTLADVSVRLMEGPIKVLGGLVTRLPIGRDYPGKTAGPNFELFYAVDYLLPHRDAAWQVMAERLREVADLAMRCRESCIPIYMGPLSQVTQSLREEAERLEAARSA